jgi:hypothetical protein
VFAFALFAGGAASQAPPESAQPVLIETPTFTVSAELEARMHVMERAQQDVTAMQHFRPGYTFWKNVFLIPDGSVAFGRGDNGSLLAVFPTTSDWTQDVSHAQPDRPAAGPPAS